MRALILAVLVLVPGLGSADDEHFRSELRSPDRTVRARAATLLTGLYLNEVRMFGEWQSLRRNGGDGESPGLVEPGKPEDVVGGVAPEVIVREVRARIGAVRACYEAGLHRLPTLVGGMRIGFVIDARGKVTKTQVEEDTLGNADVTACIVDRVKAWRLPPPASGSLTFAYPFVFRRNPKHR
ncbi:MAG TPA: AgmX/PglI C-terminal domain-containing protein [Kofleriaceae bacterium]|nr:AgmX/PglI C-terminal domain-containing protein [Kofleriaceae bacterium]